MTKLFIKPHL